MKISKISIYNFKSNKDVKNDKKYYQYGNQKFVNLNYKEDDKHKQFKTISTLSFGLACLGVGIFTKRRYF